MLTNSPERPIDLLGNKIGIELAYKINKMKEKNLFSCGFLVSSIANNYVSTFTTEARLYSFEAAVFSYLRERKKFIFFVIIEDS